MYAILLSDIHGNLFALEKVAEGMEKYDVEGINFLGNLIVYGMQSDNLEILSGKIVFKNSNITFVLSTLQERGV